MDKNYSEYSFVNSNTHRASHFRYLNTLSNKPHTSKGTTTYTYATSSPAHGCQLEFACVSTPVLEREQDLMKMDMACDKPKEVLSNADINTIHYCQSYLQIHQLSDMCTADGNYILDTVFQGEWSINQSISRTEEIIQERPDSTSWRIWRNFLRPMCYEGSSTLLTTW